MRFFSVALLLLLLLCNDASSFAPQTSMFATAPWSRSQHIPASPISSKHTKRLMGSNNLLESLTSLFPSQQKEPSPSPASEGNNPAVQLVQSLNSGDIENVLNLLTSDDCEWDDCNFYKSCVGKQAVERRLRLLSETTLFRNQQIVLDDVVVDNQNRNNIGLLFHREESNGAESYEIVDNSRGCAMVELLDPTSTTQNGGGVIKRVCFVNEPATRGGEKGLQILSGASKIMKTTGYNPEVAGASESPPIATTGTAIQPQFLSPPEQYFNAWNNRDMETAVDAFVDDLRYEDTAFPSPFVGKPALEAHLLKCSAAFPSNFEIVIDAVAVDTKGKAATCEWHFENERESLPFTQGCSYYKLDASCKQIVEGIDFIEPAVVKPAGFTLFTDSFATKLKDEPIRWIPVVSWIAYMYIVFFSDGILPGANALQLEARTWEEVINLSLNFFLVSPLLNLPFSPSVHPMLEGVFNLLLSWAAMFAGFLSDDRPRKPNLLPMFPMVAGMQFLTSAFLLPYLAVRSSEAVSSIASSRNNNIVSKEDLPVVAQIAGESRALPGLMAFVGSGSIAWFFLGRAGEYGSGFVERYASFVDLLSIDRVGSSFLVDLAIFALFQGWMVDDDMTRRGTKENEGGLLELAGKYIPFFGMAAYLLLRPSLPERGDGDPTSAR